MPDLVDGSVAIKKKKKGKLSGPHNYMKIEEASKECLGKSSQLGNNIHFTDV